MDLGPAGGAGARVLRGVGGPGKAPVGKGRYEEAQEAYRRAIAREELSEEAHPGLMRSLAGQGERARALKHHDALVKLLGEELGSSPASETSDLYERLRRGEDV